MQRKFVALLICLFATFAMAPAALQAQAPPPGGFRGGPRGGPGPGGVDILGFGCVGSRVKANAPYAGTVTETHVQLLYPSGAKDESTSTATVFRGASGDTYRQSQITFMGQTRQVICIDLASGDGYVLEPSTMKARHFTRRPPLNFAGGRGNGNSPPPTPRGGGANNATTLALNSAPQEVQNDLGFGCSTVVGTQINRGQAPRQMQSVRWFCPALDLTLYSKTIDPRGETDVTVVLNSNPAPSFDPATFLSGYTVTDEAPRGRGGRRGQAPPTPTQ